MASFHLFLKRHFFAGPSISCSSHSSAGSLRPLKVLPRSPTPWVAVAMTTLILLHPWSPTASASPAPRSCSEPGTSPPPGKHHLATPPLSKPLHLAPPPVASPESKVSAPSHPQIPASTAGKVIITNTTWPNRRRCRRRTGRLRLSACWSRWWRSCGGWGSGDPPPTHLAATHTHTSTPHPHLHPESPPSPLNPASSPPPPLLPPPPPLQGGLTRRTP